MCKVELLFFREEKNPQDTDVVLISGSSYV